MGKVLDKKDPRAVQAMRRVREQGREQEGVADKFSTMKVGPLKGVRCAMAKPIQQGTWKRS